MKDLLVNFVGAIVFSVMGYFLLKNKTEKSLIDNFVLEPSTKSSEEKEEEQLQIKEKAEKERKRRREIRKLKKM